MTSEQRLWTNYYDQKYPWSSYGTCESIKQNVDILTIEYKEASKKAIGGSKSDKARAEIVEKVLRREEGKFSVQNCENLLGKKEFESVIKPIYDELTQEYLQTATEDTQKRNKLTMGIGAAIMVVGLILIVKK